MKNVAVLFSFKGNIHPKQYIIATLAIFLIQFIFGLLWSFLSYDIGLLVVLLPIALITAISQFSFAVRRLHDFNRSGWNILWPILILFTLNILANHNQSIEHYRSYFHLIIPLFYLLLSVPKSNYAQQENTIPLPVEPTTTSEAYSFTVRINKHLISPVNIIMVFLIISVIALSVITYQQNNYLNQLRQEVDVLNGFHKKDLQKIDSQRKISFIDYRKSHSYSDFKSYSPKEKPSKGIDIYGFEERTEASISHLNLYIGDNSSKIYHFFNCKLAWEISDSNITEFASYSEARDAGFSPCSICKAR